VTLCCFDLLVCNDKPTMHLPLTRRKELLRELIALIDDPKPALPFVQGLPADANLFQSMTLPKDAGGLGLEIEGVVAKRRDSPYRPGVRSDDWRKIKRPGWSEGRLWRS
jgi:bifunctional non-homologous end joining protein LigD